jgi:GGDEF domain-containing protein
MSDSLADVLSVMVRDHCRIEAGLRDLDRWIAAGAITGPVEVAVLDLDGSAAVRAQGLAAKRHVVGQFQRLVRATAPAGASVIDSGTRDEMMIVLPVEGRRTLLAIADGIRVQIREAAFELPGSSGTVRLTTSVGVAAVSAARSAEQLLTLGREALALAKTRRDCIAQALSGTGIPMTVNVPVKLLASPLVRGTTVEDVVSRGIRVLQEKHEPMWYWVAGQGKADTGIIPRLGYAVDEVAVGTAAVRFFELLVSQISMEAASRAVEAAGTRLSFHTLDTAARQENALLVAKYLPGEWITACPATAVLDNDPPATNVFRRIDQARRSDPDVSTCSVTLLPSMVEVLGRISVRRGRSIGDLLTEALLLEDDRVRIGESTEGPRSLVASEGMP